MLDTNILAFCLAQFLLAWGLRNTSVSSYARILIVLLIIPCSLYSVRGSWVKQFPSGVGAEYVIGFILHANSFLNLGKLEPDKTWSNAKKTIWAINSSVGARWEAGFVPAFKKKDPAYIPTRWSLLLERLWGVCWTLSIIWLIRKYRIQATPDDFLSVPNDFLLRLGEVSYREAVIRIQYSIGGYTMQYMSLRACHSLLTCIALLLGQGPEQWPPLFGSLREAYTVRRFYALFWHRLMRKAFTSHAAAFCCNILRMPRNSQITRFFIIAGAFMISAIMHTFAAPGLERCGFWPQCRYYISIILAIALEDVVFGVSKRVMKLASPASKTKSKDASRKVAKAYQGSQEDEEGPSMVLRTFGYAWTAGFHVWAGSMMIYGLWSGCSA
ncbi:hypothetical protein CAC42_1738 [Sphaceloma murrayae]|uniref:Wax synthase domain-containing protein n=1 Tax=Sphaceloma murrayae TaxID=2082308 RepID=A0A2K1QHS2_9PEZI|nr:hypothetical protein CAC42_1738 [Sphaceloma murrayae]